ncbi:hypothetical protein, partial [Lysobacter sp. ISL-50]|uniref:hypothetical protein n=1 Tax=Lysobacter sp. ISL-50 TaxID=2819153 RepID=UPI001BE5D4CE
MRYLPAAAAAIAIAIAIAVVLALLMLLLLLLLSFALALALLQLWPGAACYSRDQGHPEGGAHGRAPGPAVGRMPTAGPACVGIALVALDS